MQIHWKDITAETLRTARSTIEVKISSWAEFHLALERLTRTREDLKDVFDGIEPSRWLFRGQGSSDWQLQTTLERFSPGTQYLADYYYHAYQARYYIEAETGLTWDLPGVEEFHDSIEDDNHISAIFRGRSARELYSYLLYLRHHGFPSPLLDWTRSPYVASVFAFTEKPTSPSVAIWAYLEDTGNGKGGVLGEPTIYSLGPQVRTHRRHHIQQAEYTICLAGDRQEHTFDFAIRPHNLFSRKKGQDVMVKITIPSEERQRALHYLDAHNLNPYSLLGSVDSLMQTMATRSFVIDNSN